MIKSNDFQREVELRKKEFNDAINRVLDSGWFILGKEVEMFENKFASFLGVKHCIGVANGLEALQISLMALGIGEDDEVITTPLSAMATALSIMAVGAKPIFVDIDDRGQLDVVQIESRINIDTKAIFPVHLYGMSCYPKEISELCKKYKLKYVEDACQAHGSTVDGKYLGTYGDMSCFSFYPTKNLGAFGDGGAICTNDDNLAVLARATRDYGQVQKYVHKLYGLNSRLDEMQAAILNIKLDHLREDNSRRRVIVKRYMEILGKLKQVKLIREINGELCNFHQFAILVEDREDLQRYLKEKEIPTLVHYPLALPDQPLFDDKYVNLKLPVVRSFVKKVLSLPIHPFLTNEEVEYIGNNIVEYYNNK